MAWSGYTERGGGSEQRGPGSFAFNPEPAKAREFGQAVQARIGYDAAPDVVANIAPEGPSTLGALSQFALTVAQPKINEMRDQQFLDGMRRVASGEALADIVNERPWWSQIFGDSPVEQGARMYQAETTASSIMTQVENNMDELRTKNPQELPKIIMDMTKGMASGDTQADNLVMANMLKQMPQFMKMHTKAHYAYQQEQAANAEFGAMSAAGDRLQSGLGNQDFLTPDEVEQRKSEMFASLTPAPGRNSKSHEAAVLAFVQGQADKGNFHTLAALQDSGLFAGFSPEQQLRLSEGIKAAKSRSAAASIGQYSEQISKIKTDAANGRLTAKDVVQQFTDLNRDYTQRSGNDQPLVPVSTEMSTTQSAMMAVAAIERAQAQKLAASAEGLSKARDKALARSALLADTKVALDGASVSALVSVNGFGGAEKIPRDVIDEAYTQRFVAALGTGDLQQVANVLAGSGTAVVPAVKTHIDGMLAGANGETINDNFVKGYELWKAARKYDLDHGTSSATTAAMGYFGADAIKDYQAFETYTGSLDIQAAGKNGMEYTPSAEAGFQQMKLLRGRAPKIDDKMRKDMTSRVSDLNNVDRRGLLLRRPQPYGFAQNLMVNELAEDYAKFSPHYNTDEAWNMAMAAGKARGLEMVGRYAWQKAPGSASWNDAIRHGPNGAAADDHEIGEKLDDYLTADIKALYGKEPDNIAIFRADDTNAGPRILVQPFIDGMPQPAFALTADQVSQRIRADHQAEQNAEWKKIDDRQKPAGEWANDRRNYNSRTDPLSDLTRTVKE